MQRNACWVTGFCAKDVATAPGTALIYPILFLYRHHLELELKGLLSYSLTCISQMDEAVVREKVAGHSLKSLWNTLKSHYPDCNKWASAERQKAFRDLLVELADHDPNGEAARYETYRDGKPTLDRLDVVDLPTFKVGVHKISHYLRCIYEEIGEQIEWRDEMASW